MAPIMKDTTVIYHADCPDGFGAAYAAWLVLGDRADYAPCQHGEPPPDVTGRDVYILDFSFDADVLQSLRTQARSITLLDHHRTAHDKLRYLQCGPGFQLLFDMERSGARLAWDHFHPGQPVPHLISRIEDRDLWRWQHADSRPFLTALDALPYDFQAWQRFHAATDDPQELAQAVARGQAVVERFDKQVRQIAEGAFETTFLGHRVYAANAPGEFTSDVGNLLAERSGSFGIVFRVDGPDVVKVGLRALRHFDASALAVRFGGGGHPQACAFKLKLAQLPALLNGTLQPAG